MPMSGDHPAANAPATAVTAPPDPPDDPPPVPVASPDPVCTLTVVAALDVQAMVFDPLAI